MPSKPEPQALVVGLCGHGLGLVRALARRGVRVLALEKNLQLPGARTACCDIAVADDINGDGLVTQLLALRPQPAAGGERPTLLLTNDRMVATVARHIERLGAHYRISWAGAAADVLRLLRKDAIEAQCRSTGLRYPRTATIDHLDQLDNALAGLAFPVIFKPTQPISAFKTIVVHSPAEVQAHLPMLERCMPVIAQEFIAGDDRCIHFGALLLDRGRVLARFEGRKLRSWPMGHTTVAVPQADDTVHALALQFFDGLQMSGPVSLELKRDPAGQFWVIEPTVGRTDFWIDVAVQNGVNIPWLEHAHESGQLLPRTAQTHGTLWLNGERDPLGLLWLLRHEPRRLLRMRLRGLYLDGRDMRPFLAALRKLLGDVAARLWRKGFG